MIVRDLAMTMNCSIFMNTAESSIDRLKEMLLEELNEEFEEEDYWDTADVEWTIERNDGNEKFLPLVTISARYNPDDTILGVIVIDKYHDEILP